MASVRKRANGTYQIRVYDGYDASGHQIERTMTWRPEPGWSAARTKKELERQKLAFEQEVESGDYSGQHIKFEVFVERWITQYATPELAPKTVYDYQRMLPAINAVLGHLYLIKIKPAHIIELRDSLLAGSGTDKWVVNGDLKKHMAQQGMATYRELQTATQLSEDTVRSAAQGKTVSRRTAEAISAALEQPLEKLFREHPGKTRSGTTVRHYLRLVSSILSKAVEWQLLSSNPAERVGLPRKDGKKQPVLTIAQAKRLLDCLQREPIMQRTAITILLTTGMRREELMALRWSSIDWEDGLITIDAAVQYIPGKGCIVGETKTDSSDRVIKAASATIICLQEWQSYRRTQMQELGGDLDDDMFVFGDMDGKVPNPDSLTQWFARFVKRHNLPPVHLHTLRHTTATIMIERHCPVTTVAGTLGHVSPTTTTTIYARAIARASARSAAVMDDVFGF